MEVTRLRGTERRARRKGPAPRRLAGELQVGKSARCGAGTWEDPRGVRELEREHGSWEGSTGPSGARGLGPLVWGMFGSVGVGGGWVRSEDVKDRGPGRWGVWRGR